MKKSIKTLALLLCLTTVMGFAGCGKKDTASDAGADASDASAVLIGNFDDDTVSTGDKTQSGSSTTGSGGTTGGNNGGGTVVEKPVEMKGSDPFANIPKRLKGTTVTFAHFGDEGASEYEKVLKAFTKKTGIKYKLVSYNQAEYVAQVAKQIAAKSGPDIIICNDVFPSALEIAQPLQGIIDLKDSFWDSNITNVCTVGGNTYFVNSLESVWENIDSVFYNKTLFSNNGITSPLDYYNSGKWTYENLKKCLESIKKLGYVGGCVDGQKLNAGLGNPIISYDTKTATFKANTAEVLSVGYNFAATIYKEGLWSSTDWWGTFANGNIGVFVSGLYGAKYNGFFKDMDDSAIGMVPMPTSYNGKECKPTGSIRAYGIAKGAKNPEGAAYLLRYYLDYKYYASAGASVFKNKSLEKMTFDHIIPEVKKKGINFDFSGDPMTLAGNANIGTFIAEVTKADPAQVSGLLAGKQNVFNNAASKANDKIKAFR